MIRMRVANEGEMMPYFQYELKVGFDHDESNLFVIWPMTVVPKITPDSPLYNVSASDLLKDKFEIVVILEGTVESTSMTTQARSSYLPSEIKCGHRFEPLVSFRNDTGQYAVDYSLFNSTSEVDPPLCSSRDLDELKKLRDENQLERFDRPVFRERSPLRRPRYEDPYVHYLDDGEIRGRPAVQDSYVRDEAVYPYGAYFECEHDPRSYPTHSEFEPEDEYYSDQREDEWAEYEDDGVEIDRGRPWRPQNSVRFVTEEPPLPTEKRGAVSGLPTVSDGGQAKAGDAGKFECKINL
ncbi:hypothetical protein OUZ56_017554 [Daphnia magna]|uniref:Inward rectifier potassium channel C-terminal domain-containing protein n=1 Tax=Daphnia magna TaxID=35525 RepID=A0ABR0AT40_9CRUS|nr:hypothetical protein OUZ56_017554 [Daphnia magna]